MTKLRIVIADDERPARSMLASLLQGCDDVEVVGEAQNGAEAVALIEEQRPDLALLDLQMPEIDGMGVVRLIRKDRLPLVAFVTAYDEYAIQAFEVNAVDYLLKPVDRARLRQTIERAHDRLEQRAASTIGAGAGTATVPGDADRLKAAADDYEHAQGLPPIVRIPVRRRDDIVLLPVTQVASVVADGELLHLTTM